MTRREDFKKSLLRKYWKEQKPSDKSDKYIQTTFRRRDREKMKTRRNKQNEFESLEKLKEIRDITNTTLRSILNGMKQKEELKKYLIQVNQFAFETEILEQKGELIPKELEDKWKNKMMELIKIKLLSDEKPKKVQEHDSDSPSTRPKSNYEENTDPNIKTQTQPTRSLGRKNRMSGIEPPPSSCSSRERTSTSKIIRTGRHTKTSKEDIGIKSLSPLPLKEQETKEEDNYLKLRFRINRANHLVIDRYIQKKNSFSPFDDSLTKEISKFKEFNHDFVVNVDKGGNFDNLYNQYLKSSLNDYCLFSDSEDEANFQNQIKSFQASHRQFLKQKRGHN